MTAALLNVGGVRAQTLLLYRTTRTAGTTMQWRGLVDALDQLRVGRGQEGAGGLDHTVRARAYAAGVLP